MTEIIKNIVRKEKLKVKYLTEEKKCHKMYLKAIFKTYINHTSDY
jgi:peptide deformylase